jgi:hypothetical protein
MKAFKYNYILLILISLYILSCEKESETEEVILSRMFRPPSIEVTVDGSTARFNWIAVGTGEYVLELSKDSLLFSNELQTFLIEGSNSLVVDDLWSLTRYSARVKSVSDNPATKDSEWQELTFRTGQENIFYGLEDEDIGVNSVMLKWNDQKDVSHIVLSSEGIEDVTITISDSEISAGEKLINDLSPGKQYTFKI